MEETVEEREVGGSEGRPLAEERERLYLDWKSYEGGFRLEIARTGVGLIIESEGSKNRQGREVNLLDHEVRARDLDTEFQEGGKLRENRGTEEVSQSYIHFVKVISEGDT